MEMNYLALLVAALSTLVVGFVWYHPKVFGTIWMKESGMTQEKIKGGNMLIIFGMSLLYAFLISLLLQTIVIHQMGAYSAANNIPNVDPSVLQNYMNAYGKTYRTFKHGALHGFLAGLFIILPVIGTNALYERRSFKYTLVTGGFWIICFMIMGGIICGWV